MNKSPAGNSTRPPEFANEGGTARGEVSLASFERIDIGMFESEVGAVLGRRGETVSESQIGRTSLLMRRWESSEGLAVISFRDGRVVSKSQFDLK